MARTALRIHGPAQVSNAAATKATVPANTKYIIRHIHISNTSAGVAKITVSIGADAAATRILDARSVAAGDVYDHFGYYPMEETEIIQAFSDVNNQLTLVINAEVITL